MPTPPLKTPEYYRTYERVLDHKPKSLSKDFVDMADVKDNTLDNPLLSFDVLHITLSMINSIASKRATIQYRSLLKILFSILSIFSDDSKAQYFQMRLAP